MARRIIKQTSTTTLSPLNLQTNFYDTSLQLVSKISLKKKTKKKKKEKLVFLRHTAKLNRGSRTIAKSRTDSNGVIPRRRFSFVHRAQVDPGSINGKPRPPSTAADAVPKE